MTEKQRKRYPQAVANSVGNPVDNLVRAGAVQPINLYKAFTGSRTTGEAAQEIAAALLDAIDLLNARVFACETLITEIAAALQLRALLAGDPEKRQGT